MKKGGYVYIITNFNNSTLYVGVTSSLIKRVWEHRNNTHEGFSKKYNLHKLVYYECFDSIDYAIKREKQIKGGSRIKKEELISKFNSDWKDLYKLIL